MSPRRPESPREGRLLLALAPAPSLVELRSASRGAAPAQETLRTCPGSPDSGCGGEGSPRTELWRPGTIEGGREALWPCSSRGGVGGLPLSGAHPRPRALAGAHALTLRVGRLLRRRLPLLSLPLPSSCWPETQCASARHPETSAALLPTRRCRVAAAAPAPVPGHARLACSPCPRPGVCPLHFVWGWREVESAHDFLKSLI